MQQLGKTYYFNIDYLTATPIEDIEAHFANIPKGVLTKALQLVGRPLPVGKKSSKKTKTDTDTGD